MLAALVEQYHHDGYFSDASYAVFDREQTLHQGCCGFAKTDTWFDLASLTKLFVSTAALILVERKELSLTATAGELLSEDSGLRRRLDQINLESLLTHTSGLIPWYPFYTQKDPFFHALGRVLSGKEPLSGMHYSDLNFMLVGKMIEQVINRDLPQALTELGLCAEEGPCYLPAGCKKREQLLAKLAVSSYGNAVEERMCAERGLFFGGFRDRGLPVLGQANDGNCWYYFGGISGHAGLFAPVDALVKLGRRYLNGSGIFTQATKDTGVVRGLGFEVDGKYPQGCGHTGFTGTSLWVSPNNGVGMAILANRLAFPGQTAPKDLTKFRREAHQCVLELKGAC